MKKLQKPAKINKLPFICRKSSSFILFISFLILLFSSCGIAVPYYFNPPAYIGVNLSFYNAYINDSDFALGYDFFYRIYDNNTFNNTTVITEAKFFDSR